METKEEIRHKIGDLLDITLDLTKPLPMKCEKMSFRAFTLMCGMNGSGKSVIMKLNWVMNLLANYCAYNQEFPEHIDFEREVNFLFNHTFDKNDFTGQIEVEFENLRMKLILKEGKYESFLYDTNKKLNPNPTPQYLSSETRLVSDIVKYMKFKKAIGIPAHEELSEPNLDKLLNIYKIYDIIFMESFIDNIDEFKVTEEVNKGLSLLESSIMKFNLIHVDAEDCSITNEAEDGTITDLSILSAGQQAIFVMIVATKVLTN